MKVELYYWGMQCPLNGYSLDLLEKYQDRLEIFCRDITGKPELARELGMYYPTLTIAGGRRYFSPLRPETLEAFCRGEMPEEAPYRPILSERVVTGRLEYLTSANLSLACQCTGMGVGTCGKERWLAQFGETIWGVVNLDGRRLLGGAEFLPSWVVPYDVPKGEDIAFLTCVYTSGPEGDYKSGPLGALEKYLSGKYRYLQVVSDDLGVFPNGDLPFFLKRDYQYLGPLREEPGYCRLHLLRKVL